MKNLKTYLLEESNNNLFKEICIKSNGSIQHNSSNKDIFDGPDVFNHIQDASELAFNIPNLFEKWMWELKNQTLCCIEYTYSYNNKFDKIEKILESNQFKQIEKDTITDNVDDFDYDATCIKYKYLNEDNQFIYVLKFDYGFEGNRPFRKHQYYVIFDYNFKLK